ncbi:class I SAM-dependent methyltransferase [Shewanella algae]|uniref:class I SAM-dependent methyltransferase n=1 Tax=Shewanella algae TaxID=38313 RepID=UPI001F25D238|nr:class I SAM-dependent methyltransferase [Shewanella algae]MCE9781221.1 class I SAM-dependent methyltransferase [Shewanella algae]MCE9827314.1 class I SAM-dependent methyltransferase [Shewanella algae]
MELYKDILINKDSSGPECIIFNGNLYHRYMDRIYLPKLPSELNKKEVAWLSEARLKLAEDIIDYDYSFDVIGKLYSYLQIKSDQSLLDFGCGGGMFLKFLRTRSPSIWPRFVYGLDISEYALDQAKSYYLSNSFNSPLLNLDVFNDESVIDAEDAFFDGAISSFVMHFNIYESQVGELFRVLKPGAIFCYNDYVYHKYPGHSKRIRNMLREAGFSISTETAGFRSRDTNKLKNNLIVIATKPKVDL